MKKNSINLGASWPLAILAVVVLLFALFVYIECAECAIIGLLAPWPGDKKHRRDQSPANPEQINRARVAMELRSGAVTNRTATEYERLRQQNAARRNAAKEGGKQ